MRKDNGRKLSKDDVDSCGKEFKGCLTSLPSLTTGNLRTLLDLAFFSLNCLNCEMGIEKMVLPPQG